MNRNQQIVLFQFLIIEMCICIKLDLLNKSGFMAFGLDALSLSFLLLLGLEIGSQLKVRNTHYKVKPLDKNVFNCFIWQFGSLTYWKTVTCFRFRGRV